MDRIFGMRKKVEAPSLDASIADLTSSIDKAQVDLASAEAALIPLGQKRKRYKDRGVELPKSLKQMIKIALDRRNNALNHMESLVQQNNTMTMLNNTSQNLKNVVAQVETIKATTKALKQQYRKIDIDKIEQLQDEMADLMDIGREFSETISSAYELPQDIDEEDLDAELDALGEEMLHEQEIGVGATPGFLQDEVPTFVDAPPEQGKVQEAAGGIA